MKDLVSNQIVRYLESRDVEHVFGLCGHTNIALLAALEQSEQIAFVNVRHEQIAAHAADGYARASKRTGVVLTHLGPGLTNAATGRGQRRARLDPDGGHRRRRAEPLLRQASAPGESTCTRTPRSTRSIARS